MLNKKKIYDPEEYDVGINRKSESEKIDFSGVVVNGLQMGFSYKEVLKMRLGEYGDFFEEYKLVFNMKAENRTYKMPEKRQSMLDL